MDKAVRALEKAAMEMKEGRGPWWVGPAMEMEEDGGSHSGAVEMLADGHSDVKENAEAVR